MRILILISSLEYGGAEKQAILDANLLSKDHKVFLGSFRGGYLNEMLNNNVKTIVFKKDNYISTSYRLIKFIKKNDIHIIHASLFAAMTISALASIITRVPVIWHFHSHEYDIPFRSQNAIKYLSRLKTIRQLLFVSDELKNYFFRRFKLPERKLSVLHNSTTFTQPKSYSMHDKNFINLGYVGRLVQLKRVNYLIELAKYLMDNNMDFMIHIVGDGEERKNLEQLSNKLSIGDKIKFWGFQSDTEKFYDKFDIFVLPSREECLSLSLIDAAIKGIPAVAFDVGGNNEIIINGKTGYIVYTKEEMFDKVQLLIRNESLRNQLGKGAHSYAVNLFSEEARKKALDNLHEKIFS